MKQFIVKLCYLKSICEQNTYFTYFKYMTTHTPDKAFILVEMGSLVWFSQLSSGYVCLDGGVQSEFRTPCFIHPLSSPRLQSSPKNMINISRCALPFFHHIEKWWQKEWNKAMKAREYVFCFHRTVLFLLSPILHGLSFDAHRKVAIGVVDLGLQPT